MVVASIVGMHLRGATLPFRWVTVRLGVVRTGKGDWGLVGRKSLALGTGPIDLLVSVAQSNRVCSRGTGLVAALAVGDGAGCVVPLLGSRTL